MMVMKHTAICDGTLANSSLIQHSASITTFITAVKSLAVRLFWGLRMKFLSYFCPRHVSCKVKPVRNYDPYDVKWFPSTAPN